MNINDYQTAAISYRLPSEFPGVRIAGKLPGQVNSLLGLLALARTNGIGSAPLFRASITQEMGAILFSLAALADDCDLDLAAIAATNVGNLAMRRGTVGVVKP